MCVRSTVLWEPEHLMVWVRWWSVHATILSCLYTHILTSSDMLSLVRSRRLIRLPPCLLRSTVHFWRSKQLVYSSVRVISSSNTSTNAVATDTTDTSSVKVKKKEKSPESSVPIWKRKPTKEHALIMKRLDDALRNEDVIHAWMQCQLLAQDKVMSQVPAKKIGRVFDMLVRLNSPVLIDFTRMVLNTDARLHTTEQYACWIELALKTGGTDAMETLYRKFRPMILTKQGLPLLKLVYEKALSTEQYCSVRIPRGLMLDLLELDKPWMRQFYPKLMFALIVRDCSDRLEIYKIVRKKIDDMGRMLYINIFGWINTRNAYELELAELIYEDFVKNGYILSPNTYTRLFAELLTPERLNKPELCKGITSKQRAAFLYRIFTKQAASNIFPAPRLISLFIRLLYEVGQSNDAETVYNIYMKSNPRSFIVDLGYVNVLAARSLEETDKFYHEIFDYGFRRLPNGQYIGANNEIIQYCDSETKALIHPDYREQVHKSTTDMSEQDQGLDTSSEKNQERQKVIMENIDKEYASESIDVKYFSRQLIPSKPVTSIAKHLIVEHRRAYDYHKAYRVYKRFEEIGFFNMEIYYLILWGLLWSGKYKLMDKVYENMKRRHLMLTSGVAVPYIERSIIGNNLEEAVKILHEYLKTREYVKTYEDTQDIANPGYLFTQLIRKYTELGETEKAKSLMELGYSLPFIDDVYIIEGVLLGVMAKNSPSYVIVLVNTLDAKDLLKHPSLYTMIIDYFIEKKYFDLATYWYQRGCEAGFEKEPYLFCSGLKLYSFSQNADKFMELYHKGRTQYNIKINEAILSVLCDAAGYMFTVKELDEFWNAALADGVVPNENNYSSRVEAYWRLKDIDQASRVLLEEMPAAGFAPNYYMLITLWQTATRQGNRKLLKLLNKASEKYAAEHKKFLEYESISKQLSDK
jgi:hypothetical protein